MLRGLFLALLLPLQNIPLLGIAEEVTPEKLEFFEKKIRPVLVDRCYKCHSAESEKLKGGLYLDSRDGLLKGGDTRPAIVPGEPGKSLLIEAIAYANTDLQMPPKGKLPAAQVSDFTEWVKMGAPWPKEEQSSGKLAVFDLQMRKRRHWAWKPIQPQRPPRLEASASAHPVDQFILAKLEQNGLKPAPPADQRILIRRVYFDLIGLPPTSRDVEAFLNDRSPGAYDRVIDRLLASPAFGERWARHWLDLVRFAETLGHEFDYLNHNAWRYRDYVIRAFNTDLPYDQFVTEHIAGDLLPKPRRQPTDGSNESVIATGFFWFGQRDHSPVDVRLHQAELIDNQIDVMTKTFLGLTVACARCHDHKFDAISTRDFYSLYGILEGSRYGQRSINSPEQFASKIEQLKSLKRKIHQTLGLIWDEEASRVGDYLIAARELTYGQDANQPSKVSETLGTVATGLNLEPDRVKRWTAALQEPPVNLPTHPMCLWAELAGCGTPKRIAEQWKTLREDSEKMTSLAPERSVASLTVPAADFANWYADGPAFESTPNPAGDFLISETNGPVVNLLSEASVSSSSLSRRLQGALRSPTFTISHPYIHLLASGHDSRINVYIDNFTMIRDPIYGGLKKALNNDTAQWISIDVSMWMGHQAYIEFSDISTPDPGDDSKTGYGKNGYITVTRVCFSAEKVPPSPIEPASGFRLLGKGDIDSLQQLADAYQRAAKGAVSNWVSGQMADIRQQQAELRLLDWLHRKGLLDPAMGSGSPQQAHLQNLLHEYKTIESLIPEPVSVPGMVDGTGSDEKVFIRGNHKTLGDTVPRRFLEAIDGAEQPSFREGSGRLELARRMTDLSNPFLARVMVNRVWHYLFERGIVPTPDDFGVLGQPPTHPELLDWLADWYRTQAEWSTKKLIRLLVTSDTYRMSSKPDDSIAETKDPDNILLHRMPVRRLEGEVIRDSMLTLCGQLDQSLFGPPVPIYLTEFMDGRGRPSKSGPLDGNGRRSIYIEVRRNFLSPMMRAFDTPVPFTTVGKRTVSNVPAQSLILLNDPFVISQARSWAKTILARTDWTPEQRIKDIYLSAFCRPPSEQELSESVSFLNRQGETYGVSVEEKLREEKLWTDLCHVMFNVKEFIFLN